MNYTISHSSISRMKKSDGFSLIEVLIAIIVLATGMLAMAALQSSLIRNSVESKERSQALALAVGQLDSIRAQYTGTADDLEGLTVAPAAPFSPPAVGGTGYTNTTSFTSTVSVQRLIREGSSTACGGASETPCWQILPDATAMPTNNDDYVSRLVTVRVNWTDATGAAKWVEMKDILGSVVRASTSLSLTSNPKGSTRVVPVIAVPKSNVTGGGIIPIAIGDGKETAASNPRPVQAYEAGRTDDTAFQVYTFSNEANNVARLRRATDVRVVGCRCDYGTYPSSFTNSSPFKDYEGSEFMNPMAPVFWNGKAYVSPEEADAVSLRGVADENANQNQQLCFSCCLDHHDSPTATVKFDVLRPTSDLEANGNHKHYHAASRVAALAPANYAAGEPYFEVCRFIRTDGVFRVATDARLELMNLLEAQPVAAASVNPVSIPLDSKVSRYQDMVKSFVDQKINSNVANPVLTPNFDDVLINPARIDFGSTGERAFHHNRGLYIDHLEQPALDALREARTNCVSPATQLDCILPVLPFVSINATGLANYSTTETAEIVNVVRTFFTAVGNQGDFVINARGLVTANLDGLESSQLLMTKSNAGLSGSLPIDPQDETETYTDGQAFKVGGAPVQTNDDRYNLRVVLPRFARADDYRAMAATSVPAAGGTTLACPDGLENETSLVCPVSTALPVDTKIIFTGYNFSKTSRIRNPCGASPRNVDINVCVNHSITVSGAGSPAINYQNEGRSGNNGEIADFVVSNLAQDQNIEISLSAPVETNEAYTCPSGSYAGAGCN